MGFLQKVNSCFLCVLFLQNVICFQCDFIDETVPFKQPDGRIVCRCDRSSGYIGPDETTCIYVKCPVNMEPDDKAVCQCKDEFFLRDNDCIEKSRCKLDEVTIHNGSRFDDRKCVKRNTQFNIKDPPQVMIEDITSTSIRIQVFLSENETGQHNVTLAVSTLTDGDTYQRVVTDSIGEARMSVPVIINGLEANTSYRVEVTASSQVGTSEPTLILLRTRNQVPAPEVTVRDVNQTACTLEITPDMKMDSGKISLTFRNLTDNKEGYLKKEIERGKMTTVVNVNGLVANTTYQFQVQIGDTAGLSDARQVMIQTKADVIKSTQEEEDTSIIQIIIPTVAAAVVFMGIAAVFIWRRRCNRSNNRRETGDEIQDVRVDVDSTATPTSNLVEEGVESDDDSESETKLMGRHEDEDTAAKETMPSKEVNCRSICNPVDNGQKSEIVVS